MVVLLPDGGRNYLSKLYNDEWMRDQRAARIADRAGRASRPCCATVTATTSCPPSSLARTTERVGDAIDTLQRYGISQMPVRERDDDAIEGIVGSISERSLLERAYRDPAVVERTVGEVMERPLPTIDGRAAVDEAFQLLSEGAPALVAVEAGRPVGVVTKLDLLEHLAHHPQGTG